MGSRAVSGLSVRPARADDAERLLAWRNDEATRAAAMNVDVVAPEDHLAWLRDVLADPSRHLLIIEDADGPVGFARCDQTGDAAVLSFGLAPEQRGRGRSVPALRTVMDHASALGIARLRGIVRRTNVASLRMFGSAGWTIGEPTVEGGAEVVPVTVSLPPPPGPRGSDAGPPRSVDRPRRTGSRTEADRPATGPEPPAGAADLRDGAEHPGEARFAVRQATIDDVDLLLAWRNDPQTIAMSVSKEPVAPEDHARWFERQLASPACDLHIVVVDGEPVGQARYDIDGDTAELSITLAPEARGKRYTFPAMVASFDAAHQLGVRFLTAVVKPDNVAVLKAAAQLGFQQTELVERDGVTLQTIRLDMSRRQRSR